MVYDYLLVTRTKSLFPFTLFLTLNVAAHNVTKLVSIYRLNDVNVLPRLGLSTIAITLICDGALLFGGTSMDISLDLSHTSTNPRQLFRLPSHYTRLRLALLTHTPTRAYPTTLHLLFCARYIHINK